MSFPTDSTYTSTRRSRPDVAVLREVAAVMLIALGLAGLTGAAFMVSVALGVAAVSAATIAAGVFLGLDR